MNVTPIRTPWPPWTNPEIRLFHGTIQATAEDIVRYGVDISMGTPRTDFGRGFYVTTDENNARHWAMRKAARLGVEPAVVRVTLGRAELGQLESIVFVRGSLLAEEFWSFVAHCRAGRPHRPATQDFYDVAYGPVAKVWFGNPNSAIWADYDQISFHTKTAQDMLNNKRVCALEIAS
jgi:Protein of unknown function (DUF3990)